MMDFIETLEKQFSIRLNNQQRKAVAHKNGPALVLAGPGSGKTTVITARTAYLCREANIPPYKILSMTYSRTQIKSTLGHLCAGDIDTVIDRYTAKAASGEIRNADSFIKACLLSAGKSEQLLKLSKKSDAGAIDRGNPSFEVDEYVRLSMERLHRE